MSTSVHQAVHGYSDGHRQLACSAPLSAKDARLVLVMSDLSGPGVASEGTAYLTGYPLQESGLYAIAKTWPANDMPRPGCVWTHTLFIEFADLAALESPSDLAKLFRQPTIKSLSGYSAPLLFPSLVESHKPLGDIESKLFARLATALYGHPHNQVWTWREPAPFVDDVVLRLWDQQFPRLRRTFKFCTLTTKDRSQDNLQFDLQLCPPVTSTAGLRFANQLEGVNAACIAEETWLHVLLADARHPSESLRKALRVLGADVLGGREAMQPICTFFASASGERTLSEALELVQGSGSLSNSAMAKEMLLRTALHNAGSLDDATFRFVLENLDRLDEEELKAHSPILAKLVLHGRPAKLLELCFDTRPSVQNAMRGAVRTISLNQLLEVMLESPNWIEPLLSIRPDLAKSPAFWAQTQHSPRSALNVGVELTKNSVLNAMVLGLREEGPIISCLHEVGALAVLECLQRLAVKQLEIPRLDGWIRHACLDTGAVAHFLSQPRSPAMEVVSCIAKQLHPDAVPNDFGDDPWFIALNGILHYQPRLPVELLAYGFRRALGWRSKSVAHLLLLTFEAFHRAAEEKVVNQESWRLVEDSLPWVKHDNLWDYGLRLRKAVANRCVDMQFSPQVLCELATSDSLFRAVLDEVWDQWGGSRYLKAVERELHSSDSASLRKRRSLIAEYVKQHSSWWDTP